jgi:plasmid stabilization system protein ParE
MQQARRMLPVTYAQPRDRTNACKDTCELIVHRNCILSYRVRGAEVQVLRVWHAARDKARGPATGR